MLTNSLKFIGSNYASVSGMSAWGSTYTIEFKLKLDSYNQNAWAGLVFRGNGTSAEGIYISSTNFTYRYGSSAITLANVSSYIPLNTWVHIVCILNTNTLTIYKVENKSLVTIASKSCGYINSTDLFAIGRFGSYSSSDSYLKGWMDDIRIWNKCLTSDEILNNYNKVLTDSIPNLIHYYKCNDTGNTITDYGVTKNDLTFTSPLYDNTNLYTYLLYLLKQDDDFYSIKDCMYDTTNKIYTSIGTIADFSKGFYTIDYLIKNISINSETFKPISKFGNFSIITNINDSIKIQGIKSTSELVVFNQKISTKIAQSIIKYFIDKTISGNGNIKIVISNDDMVTWKSWNGTDWINLTNTIVDKKYSDMSNDEKTQWNTFKTEIINIGMTDTILQGADFNQFLGKTLRFAFVLIKPTYSDVSLLKSLSVNYIGKDNYVLLNNSDVKVSINENYIQLTPTRDISKVKVNILT